MIFIKKTNFWIWLQNFQRSKFPRNEEYLNQQYNLNISIKSGCSTSTIFILKSFLSWVYLYNTIYINVICSFERRCSIQKSKKLKIGSICFQFHINCINIFPFQTNRINLYYMVCNFFFL